MRALPQVRGHGRFATLINQAFLKAGALPSMIVPMRGGHRILLDARAPMQARVAYSGRYDDRLIDFLRRLLPAGGVVLDVGANIGLYSIPLALEAMAKNGRLFSFEPLPANAMRLQENLALNGVEAFAEVHQIALSARGEQSFLVLREDFIGGALTGNTSVLRADPADEAFSRIPIRLERLDDLVPKLGLTRIDIIKADIEGHEYLFLEGARQTIRRFRPLVQIEINRWYTQRCGVDVNEVIPALLPDRYRLFEITTGKMRPIQSLKEVSDVSDAYAVPEEAVSRIA